MLACALFCRSCHKPLDGFVNRVLSSFSAVTAPFFQRKKGPFLVFFFKSANLVEGVFSVFQIIRLSNLGPFESFQISLPVRRAGKIFRLSIPKDSPDVS